MKTSARRVIEATLKSIPYDDYLAKHNPPPDLSGGPNARFEGAALFAMPDYKLGVLVEFGRTVDEAVDRFAASVQAMAGAPELPWNEEDLASASAATVRYFLTLTQGLVTLYGDQDTRELALVVSAKRYHAFITPK